jgi:predicted DNA-binding transcriptional regulator YafY
LYERLLTAAADDGLLASGDWSREIVFTGPPPLHVPVPHEVLRAIRRRRVLRIEYQAPARAARVVRRAEPHFLVNASGDWLLIGWDRERDAPRTYALKRLLHARETDERFDRRGQLEQTDFARHMFLSEGGGEPYELVLRFEPHLAQVATERTWHPSQTHRMLPDGGCELSLTVGGRDDVLRWILGFGAGVEVIAPPSMRARVADEVAAILGRYGADAATAPSR